MASCWEPQAEGLNQIITLLKQSQSTDNQIQRNVQLVSHMVNLKKIASWIFFTSSENHECTHFHGFFFQCHLIYIAEIGGTQ